MRLITFCIAGILFLQNTNAQRLSTFLEKNDTHKKYWYYRYRLKNDFLLIGDCQGCSLPG